MRLLELRVPLHQATHHDNDPKKKALYLTKEEWLQLAELVQVLEPFKVAVKGLEGEKYPTLSHVWATISSLHKHMSVDLMGHFKYAQVEELRAFMCEDLVSERRFGFATPLMQARRLLSHS